MELFVPVLVEAAILQLYFANVNFNVNFNVRNENGSQWSTSLFTLQSEVQVPVGVSRWMDVA